MKVSARRRRGIIAVEFALVLLPLLIVLFGIMEYGWYFLCAHEVAIATRHGARVGITVDATTTEVQTEVQALMTEAGLASKGYTLTLTPADPASLKPGEKLTVQITMSYANVSPLNMSLFPVPATLESTVAMAKEGP